MNILFSCIGKRGYVADFFRSHLEPNDRIIGTSNTPWTPGFSSCDSSYIVPDIVTREYIPAVLEVCKRESVDAILSFFDLDVMKLSGHLDDFRSLGVTPLLPDETTAKLCFDKWETFQFLVKNGIQTATTFLGFAEAKDAIKNKLLTFPVFVKPRDGYGSRHTFLARNLREMDVFFHYMDDMIIQETLKGDTYNIDVCNDLHGQVLSVVPWRKLRSNLGETEQAISVSDAALIEFGQRLGVLLGHSGPMDVDLFVSNGQIYVLEINLRFGGGYPVSHLAGADFPRMVVSMIRGENPKPAIGQFQSGVAMMKKLLAIGGDDSTFWNNDLHVQTHDFTSSK